MQRGKYFSTLLVYFYRVFADAYHMKTEHKKIKFSKMHGAGNDYIYIDATVETPMNFLTFRAA